MTGPDGPGVTGSARVPPASGPAERDRVGAPVAASANGGLQGVAERRCLVRGELDDEPAATLQGDAHDDAPPLLGDLERAVTGPRLHRRHAEPLPQGTRPQRSGWSAPIITDRATQPVGKVGRRSAPVGAAPRAR